MAFQISQITGLRQELCACEQETQAAGYQGSAHLLRAGSNGRGSAASMWTGDRQQISCQRGREGQKYSRQGSAPAEAEEDGCQLEVGSILSWDAVLIVEPSKACMTCDRRHCTSIYTCTIISADRARSHRAMALYTHFPRWNGYFQTAGT